MGIPPKLYKYQSYNQYSLANLKNNQIYFNAPRNFNDPYDCLHALEFTRLSIDLIERIYAKSSPPNERMKTLVSRILQDKITPAELVEFYDNNSKNNGKFKKVLDPAFGIDPSQYISNLRQMIIEVDQFALFKQIANQAIEENANNTVNRIIDELRFKMASDHGISCFSEVYDDMLMWSYYADGHKGYCLEFDTSEDPFFNAKRVNYVDKIPPFNAADLLEEKGESADVINIFLATKFKGWSHEREWRIIHKEASKLYTYKSRSLTGIFLGTNIDSTTLEILLIILKAQNPYVKFYKMEKLPQKFAVEAKPVNYSTHLEAQETFTNYIKNRFGKRKFTMKHILDLGELGMPEELISVFVENLKNLNILKVEGQEMQVIQNMND